jgi:voltage-gated potassium channel
MAEKNTRDLRWRLVWGGGALFSIVALGTLGYVLIEGWTPLEALYMTVITITTVGFAEVHPLSSGGRIFSIVLALGGVSGAFYLLTNLTGYIVEARLSINPRRRRMESKIDKIKDHFIICGFGRVGREIAATFQDEKVDFVVIEPQPEAFDRAEGGGYLVVRGDATEDETLLSAGIARARGLVAAVGDDATNTFIVLTAHQIRPDIFIEARATSPGAEAKLKRAGAKRVVSPHRIGGRRMAMTAIRPGVVDFFDKVAWSRGREFGLENLLVAEGSSLIERPVGDLRRETKISVLAVTGSGGRLTANPAGDHIIKQGDHLVVMGTDEQLKALANM